MAASDPRLGTTPQHWPTLCTAAALATITLCCVAAQAAPAYQFAPMAQPCRPASNLHLPGPYASLAKTKAEFAWARSPVKGHEKTGQGFERVDGSGLRDWFSFSRIDIDGDGVCDWFVIALSPVSSGGDASVLNTVYLARGATWLRAGARLPAHRPDAVGYGATEADEAAYAMASTPPALLLETTHHAPVLIARLAERQRLNADPSRLGYQLMAWDARLSRLVLLDKWAPHSLGQQAYQYFKAHGASSNEGLQPAPIERFDPDIERDELQLRCAPEGGAAAAPLPGPLQAACAQHKGGGR